MTDWHGETITAEQAQASDDERSRALLAAGSLGGSDARWVRATIPMAREVVAAALGVTTADVRAWEEPGGVAPAAAIELYRDRLG